MNNKIKGSLFVSGILFLGIFSTLFIGQLIYFDSHIKFYQNEINLKEAQTMRNIAQSHHLAENQILKFNTGKVTFQNHEFIIILKNGQQYQMDPF